MISVTCSPPSVTPFVHNLATAASQVDAGLGPTPAPATRPAARDGELYRRMPSILAIMPHRYGHLLCIRYLIGYPLNNSGYSLRQTDFGYYV